MYIHGLPGGDLISAGLADLRDGLRTQEGLLVVIGAERLRHAGMAVPQLPPGEGFPEHDLYALLAEDDPDSAHGRYNALVRRLVSFERALEHARTG